MKSLFSTLAAMLLIISSAQAQFPKKIHYQGMLQDASGPMNRSLGATFKIFDSPTGGIPLAQESKQIEVSNGLFSTVLGESSPVDLLFDKQYWLEISLDDAAPLSPRTPLLATGYAFRALTVPDTSLTTIKINKSGSKPGQGIIASKTGASWSDVVTHLYTNASLYVDNNSGDVTIGITPGGITEGLLADGAVSIDKIRTSGIPQNGQVLTFSNESGGIMKWKAPSGAGFTLPYGGQTDHTSAAFDITNLGNGPAGRFAQSGASNTPALQAETIGAGPAISATTAGSGNAGYFLGNNTSSTVPTLKAETKSSKAVAIEGIASHATAATIGISGKSLSNADSAVGVSGQVANATLGVNASGVRGVSANATANGYGVWGSHSGKGSGVYGNSASGVGVRAVSRDSNALYALHSSATGTIPAIIAESNSASDSASGIVGRLVSTVVPGINSSGVMGVITDTNSKGNGVWGWHGGRGRGIYGSSNKGVGVVGASADSIGVVGTHTATTGIYPGVRGETNSTAANATAVLGVITPVSPGNSSAAVRGINNGTTVNGIGVWGSQAGTGNGVVGSSVGGIGVFGNATSSTASNYGVWGQSASSIGTAVYAGATATEGKNYGLSAQAVSDSGIAVYGVNTSTSAAAYAGNFKGKVNVSGDITKTYSATAANPERRAMPICYGTVNANATIASGTPNFSCSWDGAGFYVIQIEGENYNSPNYTTVITPIGGTPLIATSNTLTGTFLTVRIFNLTGTNVQNGFSFVVYKP
ncbi:MAG: hypothetical protein HYZ54_14420 [Ignavibacteriae bacterium]|nr:hypothetical protein [Ignavibacteriota bacterium]